MFFIFAHFEGFDLYDTELEPESFFKNVSQHKQRLNLTLGELTLSREHTWWFLLKRKGNPIFHMLTMAMSKK